MQVIFKSAEEEYNKDGNVKREDISQLKLWLEKQPHLPDDVEEVQLIQFYHVSEYSLQRTKELLEIHYTCRTDAPELYPTPEYEPPRYKYNIWDVCYILMCPNTTPEGYRTVYCGLKDTNPAKYHFEIAIKEFITAMSVIVATDGLCPGYAFVFDLHGIGMQHLATISISLLRKFLFLVQEGVPIKVRAVHIINVTPIIDKIMFLVKPFIKKALFDILYFYTDINELYKIVPKECLPCDLGGTLPSRNELLDISRKKVEQCSEYIKNDLKRRSDESKRPGNSRSNRMAGSFKKIDID